MPSTPPNIQPIHTLKNQIKVLAFAICVPVKICTNISVCKLSIGVLIEIVDCIWVQCAIQCYFTRVVWITVNMSDVRVTHKKIDLYRSKFCSKEASVKHPFSQNLEKSTSSSQIRYTVKPLNSEHHWFSENVSAIERCTLQRGSKYKSLTVA